MIDSLFYQIVPNTPSVGAANNDAAADCFLPKGENLLTLGPPKPNPTGAGLAIPIPQAIGGAQIVGGQIASIHGCGGQHMAIR